MTIEYSESIEIKSIAQKLQEKYYPFIGYVDLEEIYFSEIIGFKPDKAPIWQISGLTQQWARDLMAEKSQQKMYCFAVWSDAWSEFSNNKKQWIIFRSLYSISPGGKGKLRTFDVQDYGFINEYFVRIGVGPYWQTKDELPSLLDGKEPLPLILPMEEEE